VKGPTKEYELARRKIKRDIDEMWFFVRAKFDQVMTFQIPDSL
jgi:hypothetical protein